MFIYSFISSNSYVDYSLYKNNNFSKLIYIINNKVTNFIKKISFLEKYFQRNYLIWNDSFLIDFAQKKSTDLWIRKFVILTAFLFSDRYLFENIVGLYKNYFISILNLNSSFEVDNPLSMLNNIIFNIVTLVLIIFLFILILL